MFQADNQVLMLAYIQIRVYSAAYMTTVTPESSSKSHEFEASKDVFLQSFRPQELASEFNEFRLEGNDITIGNTVDKAYESTDKISEVFHLLDEKGEQFRHLSRSGILGQQALRDGVTMLPRGGLKTAIRARIANQDAFNDNIRATLLYDQPDVQGMPWHRQNGRALSLGTIVDAHDLGEGGAYPTMSGRITSDLLTHQFGAETGWMAGQSLDEALQHILNSPDFRIISPDKADEKVRKELAEIADFTTAPAYEGFTDIVRYCSDSLGIRSRKEEVRKEISRYTDQVEKDDYLMMSVGCGTAQPMLEVIDDLRKKGKYAKLVLLDQDPVALAAAEQIARQMGLEDSIEIHCKQLFVGSGAKTHVMDIQQVLEGRKLDVCEDSGLREYFTDTLYKDLAAQAWNALEDGGLMTTGNMNKNRPQSEFLHGLMGWPIPVRMRHMKDLARLHKAAGIPADATRYRLTQDGVYTLCFSQK